MINMYLHCLTMRKISLSSIGQTQISISGQNKETHLIAPRQEFLIARGISLEVII
uniref:Uncharacterized protein n=1 Tax=Arundo donax TaxID=35708 RepID=A0A0A8ZKK4_ARUDO